jgi:hypothetical protein
MLIKMPPNTTRADVLNGQIDNPGGAVKRNYMFTVRSMDWEAKYPTAYNYSVSVQRQVPGSVLLDVSYVGKTANNLARNMNINQLQPGTLQANRGLNADFLRPYHGLGRFSHRQYSGRSNYNSLQITADRRFTSGLGFGVAYTFSKNIDDIKTPYDAFHANLMKSLAAADRTHLLNMNFIYSLPFLQNRRDLAGNVFGGWQLSGVIFFRSGSPLSVTDSTDIAGVGPGSAAAPWDLVGDATAPGERGLNNLWFNPSAFALPSAGRFGTAGINLLRGPAFQNWDAALFKTFRIVERLSSEFRFELFNFPNHPVLDNPSTNPRSGSFGKLTSKSGQRNMQLGLKFLF